MIQFNSVREIRKGEQITIDYKKEYETLFDVGCPCYCVSMLCSGVIGESIDTVADYMRNLLEQVNQEKEQNWRIMNPINTSVQLIEEGIDYIADRRKKGMEGSIHCPLCPLVKECTVNGVQKREQVKSFGTPDLVHKHMIQVHTLSTFFANLKLKFLSAKRELFLYSRLKEECS